MRLMNSLGFMFEYSSHIYNKLFCLFVNLEEMVKAALGCVSELQCFSIVVAVQMCWFE